MAAVSGTAGGGTVAAASEVEEGREPGEDFLPVHRFTRHGLEDDEDGFAARFSEGEPAEDGLPPVAGGGGVPDDAVGEPEHRLGGIRIAPERELQGAATRYGHVRAGLDMPARAVEAEEGIMDGMAVAGGVDHLDDDALASDLVKAFDDPGFAEDGAFVGVQRQIAGAEVVAGRGQGVEAIRGIGQGDEFPCDTRGDSQDEEDPEKSLE